MSSVTTTNNFIGRASSGAGSVLDGMVDDIRIYADVLQETDVVELFREGNTLQLTHHYEFDTPALTADSSGNGKTLTAFNSPTWTTGGCAVGSGCVLLDNSGLSSQASNSYFNVPVFDWSAYTETGVSL
eukprot:1139346-Rhodomonas_salina.1